MRAKFLFLLAAAIGGLLNTAYGADVAEPREAAVTKSEIAAKNISLVVNLDGGCRVESLTIGGRQILDGRDGMATVFVPANAVAGGAMALKGSPTMVKRDGVLLVSGILYEGTEGAIRESWRFEAEGETIAWTIERELEKGITIADVGSPRIVLKDDAVFDAALMDNGGSAWFRMLDAKPSALGQNISKATYWKRGEEWCLEIAVDSPGGAAASRFAREANGRISQSIYAAKEPPTFKSPANVNLTRFLRKRMDVFSPVEMPAGKQVVTVRFTARNAEELYGRGKLSFVSAEKLTTIANTIARVGVIDKNLMGGNNFHTGYICLHEQYIAELGIFIGDEDYFSAYQKSLDFYRDHAIGADGRVKSRWCYNAGDSQRGTFDRFGFYEAQWGVLLDSQPDFVVNVATLFDVNGDKKWLETHKEACEKALDYILKLDKDGNGLVEMKNDSRLQKKGSDWIDIVWASYENAFVNAKLYRALKMWSACETLLGDPAKAKVYEAAAAKLRDQFNKSTEDGGFWHAEKKCYIYWREADKSLHGANMVTPVNFMAIAYGICDDRDRMAAILDQIEEKTAEEKLFFWPLCLTSFEFDEVAHNASPMWPFPAYENGDLFLSWGGVGVEAYARYKPELALKYVKQVIGQYDKDGLAFQRYLRKSQKGAGDDILSGNATIFSGLYRGILGINSKHNRLYLNPHVTKDVEGSDIVYRLRGREFRIAYTAEGMVVKVGGAVVTSRSDFGLWMTDGGELQIFLKDSETPAMVEKVAKGAFVVIEGANVQVLRKTGS